MRRIGQSLAIAALLLLLSPASSPGLDWVVEEHRVPNSNVQFRFQRPISYRPDHMETGSGINRQYSLYDSDKYLTRGIVLNAISQGPAPERVGDLFLLDRAERERIADVMVDESTQGQGFIYRKIKSVKIAKIDDINGLKIEYEVLANSDNYPVLVLNEMIYVPYSQNIQNNLGSASIVLNCAYTGSPDDQRRLARTFRSERRQICQKFFNSLTILDRWR